MTRVILAAIGGVIVGAVLAGGVSLLAFSFPLQTEMTNFPLDESGAMRISGTIQTTITTGTLQTGVSVQPAVWGDAQSLQCVCSEAPAYR